MISQKFQQAGTWDAVKWALSEEPLEGPGDPRAQIAPFPPPFSPPSWEAVWTCEDFDPCSYGWSLCRPHAHQGWNKGRGPHSIAL